MTDYEKLTQCFDEIGVDYKVSENTVILSFMWYPDEEQLDYYVKFDFNNLGIFQEVQLD
jgi:hypothetical protein